MSESHVVGLVGGASKEGLPDAHWRI